MSNLKNLFFTLTISLVTVFFSCSEKDVNKAPTVENPIDDLSYEVGFASDNISLIDVFTDAETTLLEFGAGSSDQSVVTVSIDNTDLVVTEIGIGTSIITVTANDGDGGVTSMVFSLSVSSEEECPNDASLGTDLGTCDETSDVPNSYSEQINGDLRVIMTNGIPNHSFTNPSRQVDELSTEIKTYELDATPTKADEITSILRENNRPLIRFGVTLNGVVMDPAPAEPFIFEDAASGEYNWDWVFEPTNNTHVVNLDCALAHVQPDGTYHYHGDMVEYVNTIEDGLGDGTFAPTTSVQLGWAADGFPILYKYGPDALGELKLLKPSYQLRSGNRGGDGDSEPCGVYNGKYTNDYEFVSGVGDLDECNGVDRSITINGETFEYFYVLTDDFPVIPRCFVGTPIDEFFLGN